MRKKIFPIKDGPNRPVCEDPGFTGELLETPRKIVVLMPFGFEVALRWKARDMLCYVNIVALSCWVKASLCELSWVAF